VTEHPRPDASPAPAPRADANAFDLPHLDGFVKVHMAVTLLTEVMVRHGLHIERPHPTQQVAIEPRSGTRIGFIGTRSHHTTLLGARITSDKEATRRVLDLAGAPVPVGRSLQLEDRDAIEAFVAELGWPVVVKPRAGEAGRGVTTDITSPTELDLALERLERADLRQALVEEHVHGQDYRLFVEGDRVVSVILREAANVVGDGRSTVEQLVAAKNAERRRNPYLRDLPIQTREPAQRLLVQQDLTLHSVPGTGQRVKLYPAANASRGGDTTEVLADTHPGLLDVAVRAVAAIPGLRAAGLDLLAADHRVSPDDQPVAICEVNAAPATGLHSFPLYGPARPVVTALVEGALAGEGQELGPGSEHVAVDVEVLGRLGTLGARRWVHGSLDELGLEGRIVSRGRRKDQPLRVRVSGHPAPVAAFIGRAFRGGPSTAVHHVAVAPA
jgi:D-alanine-D-alanine ligase-like ATP-grasp enzyme